MSHFPSIFVALPLFSLRMEETRVLYCTALYCTSYVVCRTFSPSGWCFWEPLFATPCCNTSRATWSTQSKPSHKKPFFEVLSFSTLFGPGCCCQLVCFEFGVLHFHLPLYTQNGQVGEHVLLLWFLALVLAGCCCQLVCSEFVVLHFRLTIPETGRLKNTYVQRRNKKDLAPPSRGHVDPRGAFSYRCANAAILNATS